MAPHPASETEEERGPFASGEASPGALPREARAIVFGANAMKRLGGNHVVLPGAPAIQRRPEDETEKRGKLREGRLPSGG